MIGFGELRKFSAQWQVDITAVERVYVIDWLLKGIFDDPSLAQSLALRGGAALRYAYCAIFPLADDPDLYSTRPLPDDQVREALASALGSAASASGLKFSLVAYERGGGKIEYTGPLGRRSAAQPRVSISIVTRQARLELARAPLLHPFSDACTATLNAVALDEMVGEQMAALAGSPRTRDVYDLWFALTQLRERVNMKRVREIAPAIARERNLALPLQDAIFSAAHRAILERAWDNALRDVRGHPSFEQVEKDLQRALEVFES